LDPKKHPRKPENYSDLLKVDEDRFFHISRSKSRVSLRNSKHHKVSQNSENYGLKKILVEKRLMQEIKVSLSFQRMRKASFFTFPKAAVAKKQI
jgi:hypothetical protein